MFPLKSIKEITTQLQTNLVEKINQKISKKGWKLLTVEISHQILDINLLADGNISVIIFKNIKLKEIKKDDSLVECTEANRKHAELSHCRTRPILNFKAYQRQPLHIYIDCHQLPKVTPQYYPVRFPSISQV